MRNNHNNNYYYNAECHEPSGNFTLSGNNGHPDEIDER